MKLLFFLGIGLLFLNSCVFSNRLHWYDPDTNAFNRVKSDTLNPFTTLELAKQEKGFLLPVPPTIITWDKKKSDYALTFNISTDRNLYQKLEAISFAIYYPDNTMLLSGNAPVQLPFEKSGEPYVLSGKTYQQYRVHYQTDYNLKVNDKGTDFRIDFTLFVKDSLNNQKTFLYRNYKLKRGKPKRFGFFISKYNCRLPNTTKSSVLTTRSGGFFLPPEKPPDTFAA